MYKTTIALAAIALCGTLTMIDVASARHAGSFRSGGPSFHGGPSFSGPRMGGPRFSGFPGSMHIGGGPRFHNHRRGPIFFGGLPYASPYAYGYYDSCYQLRPVMTPFGVQLRRVWVCY